MRGSLWGKETKLNSVDKIAAGSLQHVTVDSACHLTKLRNTWGAGKIFLSVSGRVLLKRIINQKKKVKGWLSSVWVGSIQPTEDQNRTERWPGNNWTLPLPGPACPSPVLGSQSSTTASLFQSTDGKSWGFLSPVIARAICLCSL